MPRKKTSSVFISHSSKDNEFALWLADELKKHGIKVWLDAHKLKPGDPLYGAIGPALKEADHFIIILSGNSIESPWVERELEAAMNRETKEKVRNIIIPVKLEDVEVPIFIEHKKYADFTSENKYDDELATVLEVFGIKVKKSVPPPPVKKAALYPNQFLPNLDFFVGREDLLKKIKETLSTHHRAAIHDISGLGKTFTSYKYVQDNQTSYEKIFFIRATREEMLESLAKCGEMIDGKLSEVTEQESKALGFKQWLEENEKWLIVYDNVDEPARLRRFVPQNKGGDCLFTSNFRDVNKLGTDVSIKKLEKFDAEMLLFSRANNEPNTIPNLEGDEKEAFEKIVREIDGLPLTLNSTGAIIDKRLWSFADFWQRYEKAPELAWGSEDDYSDYQHKSAGKIFSFLYCELCESGTIGEAVKIVLDSISFISPDKIPEDLLLEILEIKYKPYTESADRTSFWDSARGRLTAYDLLKYDKQKKTFTTHLAIQRVIQSKLKKGKRKNICVSLASIFCGLFPLYNYSNREICENYYQHIVLLLENTIRYEVLTANVGELYYRAGFYQNYLANYVQAEKFHLRATEISASIFGLKSAIHSRNLNDLGLVYLNQRRYEEAEKNLEEALEIAVNTVGRESTTYAKRLNNMAGVYRAQGKHVEAVKKLEEALEISEKTNGPHHSDHAKRLTNLGCIYQEQGDFARAETLFLQAKDIREKILGKLHPDTATSYWWIGVVNQAQEKYSEALSMFETAYEIYARFLGADHPNAINLRENYLKPCREQKAP